MSRFVVRCPSCDSELRATRLGCQTCGTHLDGQFEIPPLLQLSPEDLAFVTAFVRASGSLKAMAQHLQISYPTVRNRLDEVIARLEALEQGVQRRRHEILDALENGRLSAREAEEALRKVGL
ncbi:hypothetical protein SOCE26_019930 [Sorangium cellulosum]|uniref:DUF2089 domain-containing protein n=1 Tax=Sorangium cellulosum TaxID=56 RepID=A0A2L0EMW0_SORCE|nr:DUF2089 domain-containing protein [Sorangium cellulosum]AUX40592.1 hypothetical protein SOCE26_019930 [Sorangium cellulosum]